MAFKSGEQGGRKNNSNMSPISSSQGFKILA